MVFCVRQLVEKTIENHSKIFFLFADLHKVYDLCQGRHFVEVRCS